MSHLIAALDGSAYADSVCDYAAWFAGRLDLQIRLLAAAEAGRARDARATLRAGIERLAENGAEAEEAHAPPGGFVSACIQGAGEPGAALILLGKRGRDSPADARALGAQVARLIGATDIPLCLASRTFLPIGRAVALLDADPDHHRTVDYLCAQPGLSGLDLDVIVAGPAGQAAEDKLAWTRRRLPGPRTQVIPVTAGTPGGAVSAALEGRPADLVIVSRAVLAVDPQALGALEANSLWGWRTPVLVC